MRKTLTDRGVEKLEIKRGKAYAQPDPELTGHYVRVQPTGAKSFAVAARDPSGKQKWATIGAADVLSIEDARKQARVAIAPSGAANRRSKPRQNRSKPRRGDGLIGTSRRSGCAPSGTSTGCWSFTFSVSGGGDRS